MYKVCKSCSGIFMANNDRTICAKCNGDLELINTNMPLSDTFILPDISNDFNFIKSMMELHDTDIIEYTAKMNQFKQQVQSNNNIVKCPKCNSTSITTGARGVNWTFGLIGASKTVNRCANCGYTWKP